MTPASATQFLLRGLFVMGIHYTGRFDRTFCRPCHSKYTPTQTTFTHTTPTHSDHTHPDHTHSDYSHSDHTHSVYITSSVVHWVGGKQWNYCTSRFASATAPLHLHESDTGSSSCRGLASPLVLPLAQCVTGLSLEVP